ncbi:MAG: acetyl-CoA carboxylase biotin carboxyl carrier protein [Ruminococcaceae bacterium]|nr:acetyl-CoA carboxylase biotin carboxyl carrier protein [Oscillospiraceae bacterium]
MDKKELLETVNALTEQVNNGQLDELEVETDEFRIRLSKRPPMPPIPPMPPVNMAVPTVSTEIKTQISETVSDTVKTVSGKIIKSPIIGTFYAAAAPGKPAFVSVGSKVAKGGVVCIVESMKLMNEITSEFDGTVAEIFVNDGEAVEFDQPLFRLD